MATPHMKYALSSFEGEINPGKPQGLELYINTIKDTEKESDKLDI